MYLVKIVRIQDIRHLYPGVRDSAGNLRITLQIGWLFVQDQILLIFGSSKYTQLVLFVYTLDLRVRKWKLKINLAELLVIKLETK